MTVEEAKKIAKLECALEFCKKESMLEQYVSDEKWKHFDVAVNAIKKQIPKKPIITIDGFFNGQPIYDTWGCPNCGKVNETDFEDYEYCPVCGQALDWGDTR